MGVWSETFNRKLAQGHDHGSAAHAADQAEARNRPPESHFRPTLSTPYVEIEYGRHHHVFRGMRSIKHLQAPPRQRHGSQQLAVVVRRDTGGMITTKTAADIAAKMVTGLLEPIYHQIDPVKIGENTRAMNITKMYGSRLNAASGNLASEHSLNRLVAAYPDHGFVIDREEAKLIFSSVLEPNRSLGSLIDAMGDIALMPAVSKDPHISYLSPEVTREKKSETPDAPVPAAKPRRSGKAVPDRARANGRAQQDHAG